MNTHADPNQPLIDALTQAFPDAPEPVRGLRDRLATRAERAGLLDVAYRVVTSPLGDLLLAASESGLLRVAFCAEDFDAVLQSLSDRVSPRVLEAPARLDTAAREIDEYFAGRRRAFDLPLDRRLSTGFRGTVLRQLSEIEYGATATYGAIARRAGNPKAVRAVGTACATNPLPLVVPCHRVVRSDGTIGGYLGGVEAKRMLLALEAA
jgi:methylated-DNA-[protein]-cysteine S-methyltransferase